MAKRATSEAGAAPAPPKVRAFQRCRAAAQDSTSRSAQAGRARRSRSGGCRWRSRGPRRATGYGRVVAEARRSLRRRRCRGGWRRQVLSNCPDRHLVVVRARVPWLPDVFDRMSSTVTSSASVPFHSRMKSGADCLMSSSPRASSVRRGARHGLVPRTPRGVGPRAPAARSATTLPSFTTTRQLELAASASRAQGLEAVWDRRTGPARGPPCPLYPWGTWVGMVGVVGAAVVSE